MLVDKSLQINQLVDIRKEIHSYIVIYILYIYLENLFDKIFTHLVDSNIFTSNGSPVSEPSNLDRE
jgi:hypothetical protein